MRSAIIDRIVSFTNSRSLPGDSINQPDLRGERTPARRRTRWQRVPISALRGSLTEAFSARVRNLGPADGDLIPGTRRVVRGRNSQRLGDIDGSLYRAVRRLREIDAEAIRTLHGAEAESGAEEFFAISCTNARIGKQVRKAVIEENHGFSRSIIEDLYPRVVVDAWTEEYEAIARLDFAFVPSEVRPLVARRCAEVARTTETNARPNDPRPETLWTEK